MVLSGNARDESVAGQVHASRDDETLARGEVDRTPGADVARPRHAHADSLSWNVFRSISTPVAPLATLCP